MFEIYQSEKNKKFYFRLKAANGQIILTGQAYKDKGGCENGVKSVMKNSQERKRFEIRDSKDGKKYFVLYAGNGQEVGRSQMYKSESGLRNGIVSVGKNAPEATIKDLTA